MTKTKLHRRQFLHLAAGATRQPILFELPIVSDLKTTNGTADVKRRRRSAGSAIRPATGVHR